jgi:hypothetical protein
MNSDSSGDDARDGAINRWRDTVGARLLRVLAPIYKEGFNKPELIGTGVLIRLSDQVFLVSAAHVADQITRGPHYFGVAGRLINLPGFRITSPIPASGTREDDPIDLASWVLDPVTQRELASADALAVTDLDAVRPDDIPEGSQYFLNGYPYTRQPRRLEGDEWSAQTLAFITEERPSTEYGAVGRDRAGSVFVSYSKGNFFRYGEKRDGPDLQGVSGGAIWRLGGPACSPQRPLLTAIATTWRRREPLGVVGTRIRVLLRQLSNEFPNIAQAVRAEIAARGTA